MRTRKKSTYVNIIFSAISFTLKYALNFVIRNFVILYLGVQYLGLNNLFGNILAILSLVEAGFGTALTYAMYKPMADGDYKKVNAILRLYRKYYTIIAGIILTAGLCLIPFLKYLVKNNSGIDINLTILYLIYLTNTLISYCFAHRRSLLVADQRQDIETKTASIICILLSIAQITVICLFKNYYVYMICMPVFTLLEVSIIGIITNKKYKHIIYANSDEQISEEEIKVLKKNIYSMFYHKIGGTVLNCTDSLIISTVLGLSILGIYSNYLMIISGVGSIISIFIGAIRGSVGNLISSADKDYTFVVYKRLDFLFYWLITLCITLYFSLIQPFISIWIGNDYLLGMSIVIMSTLMLYVNQIRQFNYCFKECCGLFWENRFAPIIEVVINLVLSIVLGKFFGLIGVIIGTVASGLFVPYWCDKYIVFKYYFKNNQLKSIFLKSFYNFIITVLCCFASYYLCSIIVVAGWAGFILKAIVCAILTNIILLISYFWTSEFKDAKKFLFSFIKK